MKKWTSLFAAIPTLGIAVIGCLQTSVSFDPPPYTPVAAHQLPSRVDNAFKRDYPAATIQQIESLTWPPTGKEHFRITFALDDEVMQVNYREGGDQIRDSLRPFPPAEEIRSELED